MSQEPMKPTEREVVKGILTKHIHYREIMEPLITDLADMLATYGSEREAEGLEKAAITAENEPEPEQGKMPPMLIDAVLSQNTLIIEGALIGAVRATKKCIATAIRALKDKT